MELLDLSHIPLCCTPAITKQVMGIAYARTAAWNYTYSYQFFTQQESIWQPIAYIYIATLVFPYMQGTTYHMDLCLSACFTNVAPCVVVLRTHS